MLLKREKVINLLALHWHDRFEAFFIIVLFPGPGWSILIVLPIWKWSVFKIIVTL